MGLTKTDFMSGMQCEKMLWLDRHHPELKNISQETIELLDNGNVFGDQAMGILGPYVEIKEYYPNTTIPNKKAMARKTLECIAMHTPVICEAAFIDSSDNYCAVDILKYNSDLDTYDIYEVKNVSEVATQHIQDVCFQAELIKRVGLKVNRIHIVSHGPDEENPFVIKDVTDEAAAYIGYINDNIGRLNVVKTQETEPSCPMGIQCDLPYECWYKEYCRG